MNKQVCIDFDEYNQLVRERDELKEVIKDAACARAVIFTKNKETEESCDDVALLYDNDSYLRVTFGYGTHIKVYKNDSDSGLDKNDWHAEDPSF